MIFALWFAIALAALYGMLRFCEVRERDGE